MAANKWFTNITDKQYTGRFDSRDFHFAPGETKLLPDYLANHFANHLADILLHAEGKQVVDQTRQSILDRILVAQEEQEHASPVEAEVAALNTPMKKKPGRPPKKTETEEVFEGLAHAGV